MPSDEGPHRKYYGITREGRATLERQGKTWRTFAGTMEDLLEDAEAVA